MFFSKDPYNFINLDFYNRIGLVIYFIQNVDWSLNIVKLEGTDGTLWAPTSSSCGGLWGLCPLYTMGALAPRWYLAVSKHLDGAWSLPSTI